MCDALGRCGACIYDNDCKHDHMGTGDAICAEFQCAAPEELCKKHFTCLSFEEEMMYGYLD